MLRILSTYHISKAIRGIKVLNGVSINVGKSEIYSLVGSTGSGKTCLLRIITGLMKQDEGTVYLLGSKNDSNRNKIISRCGVFLQGQGFYKELSVAENMDVYSRMLGLYKTTATEEALELTGLSDYRKVKVQNLSLMHCQRLGVARALLNHPDLLILDEPFDEMDPLGIRDIRELFLKLNKEKGVSILLTSRNLTEIEHFSDRIGILHEGYLMEEIHYKDLRKKIKKANVLRVEEVSKTLRILESELHCFDYEVLQNDEIHIYDTELELPGIIEELVKNQVKIQMAVPQEESLESYFIKLTGGRENA